MTTVTLNPERLREIFEKSDTQAIALVSVYKEVFPDWDNIEKVDGWPTCNKETWNWFFHKCRDFDDRVTNPRLRGLGQLEVLPGGLWFNNGFSCAAPEAKNLAKFEIIPCSVTMKKSTVAA